MLKYSDNDFSTLLMNITGCIFTCYNGNDSLLDEYEKTNCFNKDLQPLFTKPELLSLISDIKQNTYYRVIDFLGIGMIIFRFKGSTWISYPFVRKEWDREKMERILASSSFTASFLPSLELYYTSLPLLSSTRMMKLITSIIQSFSPSENEFGFIRIEGNIKEKRNEEVIKEYSVDYSSIYRRYDIENSFIRMVREGNVEELRTAISEMIHFSSNNDPSLFLEFYAKNASSGMSVLRTLTRKAAEEAGVNVVTIDRITQSAVQKINTETNTERITKITLEMVIKLAEEARKARSLFSNLSPAISRCVDYIRLHYPEEISLSVLIDIAAMSKANLTRRFLKETGYTVSSFIRDTRCYHAKKLLENSELSIKEISSYVGYEDYNYFTKVFRSVTNLTPSEYRSQHSKRL
ncbi:MAG: AraC family transcriptional regulator [Spirochaetales bacterium]|nr:AraC family transcriptional regulator [Spirochaetales bacterium]